MHVDGNRVSMRPDSEIKWVALNKPKGVICTVSDELGRPTAVASIPRGLEMRLVPVGRLDRDSCGLLLLTNENSWVSGWAGGPRPVFRVSGRSIARPFDCEAKSCRAFLSLILCPLL